MRPTTVLHCTVLLTLRAPSWPGRIKAQQGRNAPEREKKPHAAIASVEGMASYIVLC